MQALIVDDSRVLRRLLGDMLRQIGFDVLEAGNGSEGLEQLQRSNPDVALVDWNMPVMNGLQFVQSVRSDALHSKLPIIMVTSETELDRMQLALEAGANEYVMKPFGKEFIAEKLQLLGF
jgi:two-component system chemotaxis response regulator CheY